MPVDTNYALAMSNGIASVAPLGTAAPTDLSALSAPWVDLGAMSTAGLTEAAGETRTDFKRWGSITTFKSVVTDVKKTFEINCLERNPNVLSLFYKATATVGGAGTNEVQTVTITGVPTGGTFVLTYGNVATNDIAYNAAAAAVQTALQALPGIGAGNATVTGSAGGPFTVTFTGALAGQNVPALTSTADFTGGTSPAVSVATPTQGVTGSLVTLNDDTTGFIDLRAFVFDVLTGGVHDRFYCGKAEVTARKNPVYTTAALTEYGMTITAYPSDSTGFAVQRIYTPIA